MQPIDQSATKKERDPWQFPPLNQILPGICSVPCWNRRDSPLAACSLSTDPPNVTGEKKHMIWPGLEPRTSRIPCEHSDGLTELPSHTVDLWVLTYFKIMQSFFHQKVNISNFSHKIRILFRFAPPPRPPPPFVKFLQFAPLSKVCRPDCGDLGATCSPLIQSDAPWFGRSRVRSSVRPQQLL